MGYTTLGRSQSGDAPPGRPAPAIRTTAQSRVAWSVKVSCSGPFGHPHRFQKASASAYSPPPQKARNCNLAKPQPRRLILLLVVALTFRYVRRGQLSTTQQGSQYPSSRLTSPAFAQIAAKAASDSKVAGCKAFSGTRAVRQTSQSERTVRRSKDLLSAKIYYPHELTLWTPPGRGSLPQKKNCPG